jgi:hypothetical protein
MIHNYTSRGNFVLQHAFLVKISKKGSKKLIIFSNSL